MPPLSPRHFQTRLLSWFDQHGRKHLPWQQNKTPYRVWVSEIMLQQTQVATATPYFERFMQTFPDLAALANAHEDDVLHLWAGLGYYSRARNLHRGAKMVMDTFQGALPGTVDALTTIPGIGPSTAGAIAAIAFNQPATILDGNVKRVLARLHGITDPINEKSVENALWTLAVRYTPAERTADYTQAIMDVGATLCTRSKPQCEQCPFMKQCVAYREGLVALIPRKKTGRTLPVREATLLILQQGAQVLLCKRPDRGIWGGLWSLPEVAGQTDASSLRAFCREHFQLTCSAIQALTPFRHTFSHYHLDIFPVVMTVKPRKSVEAEGQIWYNPCKPAPIGLPKPIQTIMGML